MLRNRTQRNTILILLLLSLLYFVLFIPPNIAASKNLAMISVFEPDEDAELQYALNMIRPADNLKNALIQFFFYKFYFYGFPHFAYSAALLLPLRSLNLLENTSLVMVTLRQMVSLLPLLAAIWLLVYLQTRFKGYRAILLFVFLVSLPVVFRNNFWWHPDGLAILFAMLAIFFLERDELRFGKNYYLAAVMCGFSAATKGIGLYFFLAIAVYLLLGLFSKKIAFYKIIISAFGFLVCMASAYLLAIPILVYPGIRERYFQAMTTAYKNVSQGYELGYAKGFSVALESILRDYANLLFLILVLAACVWAIVRDQRQLLHILILAWLIPISFLVSFIMHYKFQYWLPVGLPLFSTFIVFFPEHFSMEKTENSGRRQWLLWLVIVIVGFQFGQNISRDVKIYSDRLFREQTSPAIGFYDRVEETLKPLPSTRKFHVYHDVRMYIPPRPDWYCESIFEMLDYAYLQEKWFDVILLRQQRIFDYLHPDAIVLDAAQLAASQAFYRDAQAGNIKGYRLLYRDAYGLIFVSDRLYENCFRPAGAMATPAA